MHVFELLALIGKIMWWQDGQTSTAAGDCEVMHRD